MSGVPLARCEACGLVAFPQPSLCSRCGAASWAVESAWEGVVEEITQRDVRRTHAPGGGDAPVFLASVRTPAGPRVTARCEPATRPGDVVGLELEGTTGADRPSGRLVARARPGRAR